MLTDILFVELTGTRRKLGHVLLNRPKALNALTDAMNQRLLAQLDRWANDDQIDGVIIEGAGDRAFCAGGDIRDIYYQGKDNIAASMQFFRHEYQLNQTIYHFPKPYIALLDGITMGGGAGVSIHGSHPIATDRLVFAMPEARIGLFPDVGMHYHFVRCKDHYGAYLALSGNQIDANMAVNLQLVKAVIDHHKQQDFIDALLNSDKSIDALIDIFKHKSTPVPDHHDWILQCFSADSLAGVLGNLKQSNNDWVQGVYQRLLANSPTSLQIIFHRMRHCAELSFDQVMAQDVKLAQYCLEHDDFYEGIRAAIIDKDKSPRWQTSQLSDQHINSLLSVC